ncbi:hypothetical protein BDA99DRAFT_56208 [Phascolomyces articulosus]|uniref:RING-type domain-containing protein n=1 Tax=Phascolomyces articulosus TaxID=60185 RepID=A0AAD5K1C1_9FUNG|nr:hypothetical protein BDA99DRAFT_56208 [Phascolomyces articulosus]
MMSQPSIALIGRGGRCNYWSDKINHTQALSEVYNLNIGAALVYDNMTYGPGSSTELVQLKTDNGSYPTWPDNGALQPQGRDIRYMADNDIVDNNGSNESGASDSTFMAVYFGPNHYGRVLQDMIHNYTTTPSSSMQQYYVQLTFFFAETTFTTTENEPNNGNGGNGNNDDGRSDMWTVFTGERGYLAYLIAAGAALILDQVIGVVLLRWCRNPREADPYPSRSLGDAENGIYLQPTGQGATGERRRKMSLNKLNDMCPVQSLVVGEIQTKNSVCAICLEELEQDDLVRVLPCGHGFCVACIDVWLTKKSCLCPICKYDCDPREEQQDATNEERQQGQPRGSVDLGDPRASETHEAGSPETTAAVTSTNNNNNTTTTAADSSSSHSPSTREVAPSSPSSSTAPASPPPQYRPPSPNTITDNNATTSVLMSTTQSPSTTVNTSSNVVSTPSQLPQ